MEADVSVGTNGEISGTLKIKATGLKGFHGAFQVQFLDEKGRLVGESREYEAGVNPKAVNTVKEVVSVFVQPVKEIRVAPSERVLTLKHFSVDKEMVDSTAKIALYFKHDKKPLRLDIPPFEFENYCKPIVPVFGVPLQLCVKAGYDGKRTFIKPYDVKVIYMSLKNIDPKTSPLKVEINVQQKYTIDDLAKEFIADPQPFKDAMGIKGDMGAIIFKLSGGGGLDVPKNRLAFSEYKIEMGAGFMVGYCLMDPNFKNIESIKKEMGEMGIEEIKEIGEELKKDNLVGKIKNVFLKKGNLDAIIALKDLGDKNSKGLGDLIKVFRDANVRVLINDILTTKKSVDDILEDKKYQVGTYTEAVKTLKEFSKVVNTIKSQPDVTEILKDPAYQKLIDIFTKYGIISDMLIDIFKDKNNKTKLEISGTA